MSHIGNWPRSPRKMALETERARRREADFAAQPAVELVFEYWPESLLETHPGHAASRDWNVSATCTCGRSRWIDLKALLSTYLAHAPWPRVMQSMTCEECGGQPMLLSFDTEPRGLENRRLSFGHVKVSRAPRDQPGRRPNSTS